MKALVLLLLCSLASTIEPSWNRLREINEVFRSDVNEGDLKVIGASVFSGLSVTSEISAAVFQGEELQQKSSDLTESVRKIRNSALRLLASSTEANRAHLALALSEVTESSLLNSIQLSSDQLLGLVKKAYFQVEEFLGQLSLSSQDLMLINEDLAGIVQSSEGVNKAGSLVNEDLKAVIEAGTGLETHNYSAYSTQRLLEITNDMEISLDSYKESLSRGLELGRSKVSSFFRDVSEEVESLEESVKQISLDIREGISAVLLGQLEQDTKQARECYRRIFEKMNHRHGQKTNFQLLIASGLSESEVERKEDLIDYLGDSHLGLKNCIQAFRAIYDPARGPPTNPRGFFEKVSERFLFEFQDRSDWISAKARQDLNKFPLMATQLLIKLTNLFIFDASYAASFREPAKDKETMHNYISATVMVLKRFRDTFPNCHLHHPLLEGMERRRIYCDRKLANVEGKEPISLNQQYALRLGSVCSFECYGTIAKSPSLICGPGGEWSIGQSAMEEQLLSCLNGVEGQCSSELKGTMNTPPGTEKFGDCSEIKSEHPSAGSGVYEISVPHGSRNEKVMVYCDMETYGGGWTVFQKRYDGSVDFERNSADYENGFGNVNGEHWLGLRTVHALSSKKRSELLLEVHEAGRDCDLYSLFNHFSLTHNGRTDFYRLQVSGFVSGTADKGLLFQNGMDFSTYDQDRDQWNSSCAVVYRGGWWHNKCFAMHLNGPYRVGNTDWGIGIVISDVKGLGFSFAGSQMKFRPSDFRGSEESGGYCTLT